MNHADRHAGSCAHTTRRALLGGVGAAAAAIGAGTLLRPGAALAEVTTAMLDAKPRRVDTHHHFFPPDYMAPLEKWAKAQPEIGGISPPQKNWSKASDLESMDQNDVATSILSISTPGVWFGDAAQARQQARMCNEYAAQMIKDKPGRYGLFAAMPMPDVDGTLKEIEYALDTLHADGIGFMTSYGDKWPGDPAFKAVFEELDRRKAVAYFHPLAANCCTGLIPGVRPDAIEYPIDTTRAVTSLLFNGTFTRFQNIRFLFSHAGGAVPQLSGRLANVAKLRKDMHDFAPKGVEYELQRLYYDTANATAAPTMAALLKLVPASQVTFGTDYPYYSLPENIAGLSRLSLTTAERYAIDRGTSEALMPRLAQG